MNRREEIEKIIAEVKPRLEALRESALEEIRAEQERAEANVERFDRAIQELSGVEAEISRLSEERDQLAYKTYQAWLDGESDVTEQLRKNFRHLRFDVQALEKRRSSLSAELHRLSPRGRDHRAAVIEQLGNAAGVAYSARAELEELQDRLTQALDSMLDPVAERHNALRGTVEQLGRHRAWAERTMEEYERVAERVADRVASRGGST